MQCTCLSALRTADRQLAARSCDCIRVSEHAHSCVRSLWRSIISSQKRACEVMTHVGGRRLEYAALQVKLRRRPHLSQGMMSFSVRRHEYTCLMVHHIA